MNTYRARMRGHKEEGLRRVDDSEHETYNFFVRMKGNDRSNMRKAIEMIGQELGMVPSNPLVLSYLLRKFVARGENKSEGTSSQ